MPVKVDARKAISGLNGIADVIPQVGLVAGKALGEHAADNMERRAHKITGRLKNSIVNPKLKIHTPYQTRIGADAPYAFIETSREGHDFFFGELAWISEGAWADYWLTEFNRKAPR